MLPLRPRMKYKPPILRPSLAARIADSRRLNLANVNLTGLHFALEEAKQAGCAGIDSAKLRPYKPRTFGDMAFALAKAFPRVKSNALANPFANPRRAAHRGI